MSRLTLLFLFPLLCWGAGCHPRKTATAPTPPLRVESVAARVDTLPYRMDFVSYLSSNYDAVIQPRINGYLTARTFEYGTPVKRGQLLFTIDANLLSTTLLSARASLESARAQALEAENNYRRAVPLARINAISQAQLDQYTAQNSAAQSAVRSAEQALRNATLEVGYARITAPIDGVIADAEAHVGDYVGPGTRFEVLTTISNIDTLSADVAVPMNVYLRHAAGTGSTTEENRDLLHDIRLTLSDGSVYPLAGVYGYTRKNIASSAGTIVLVVNFPNPDYLLRPGQFGRVQVALGRPQPSVVVPQRSVSRMQGTAAVWVVRPDSTVEYRRVKTGRTVDSLWCIDEGLQAGERVLVSGLQKVHAGMKVAAVNL